MFLEIYLLKTPDLKYFLSKSWQKTEDDDQNNHKNNKKKQSKKIIKTEDDANHVKDQGFAS